MKQSSETLLIKRYASRRLYNTETSDYVTLDDIARFVRDGRDVQIIDLKSGDDLTRQYLLQIIADHESRGENVLPIEVLTDLVRSYSTHAQSVVPQFLAASFEMMRDGQAKLMENLGPIGQIPGFEVIQAQQEAFFKAMGQSFGGFSTETASSVDTPPEADAPKEQVNKSDLDQIKAQLQELQSKLANL